METISPATSQMGIARGLGLTLALHAAATLAVCIGPLCMGLKDTAATVAIWFATSIGLSQWLYMAPALWYTRRPEWMGVHKGLRIGSAITLLSSAIFWVVLLVML